MPGIRIYPNKIETEQQHRIGLSTPDRWGDLWSYVEFTPGDYKNGQVVGDQGVGDLISNSGLGTVTAAAEVGSKMLKDTGEFNGKDLRGAIGHIVDGSGVGQTFIVIGVKDADTLLISVPNQSGEGWKVALDTTSKYRLKLPGRVAVTATPANVRGVVQADDFSVPANQKRYGFVRQGGLGDGLINASGTALSNLVTVTTGGLIIGTSSPANAIGKTVLGDLGGTVDARMPIDFDIRNTLRSYRVEKDKEEPYHNVII